MGRPKKSEMKENMEETKIEASVDLNKVTSVTDVGWTEFFLSHLQPNEFVTKETGRYPTCDGLRRVFHKLIGNIISTKATVVEPARDNNMQRATVTVSITYKLHGREEIFDRSDSADVFYGNTRAPFCKYPSATATTIAEARALKKAALLVKVLTADEADQPDEVSNSISDTLVENNASSILKNTIVTIAKRIGVNVPKTLAYVLGEKNSELEKLSHENAQKVIAELARFDRGPDNDGRLVPDELKI